MQSSPLSNLGGASNSSIYTLPISSRSNLSPAKMVNMTTFFGMSLGAFVFWQSMDKVHVWIALHQDEKKEREEKEAEIRRVREQFLKENREREQIA